MLLMIFGPDGSYLCTRTYDSPGHGSDVADAVAGGPGGRVAIAGYEMRDDIGEWTNFAVRVYDPEPGSPATLAATGGAGQIALNWSPAAPGTYAGHGLRDLPRHVLDLRVHVADHRRLLDHDLRRHRPPGRRDLLVRGARRRRPRESPARSPPPPRPPPHRVRTPLGPTARP